MLHLERRLVLIPFCNSNIVVSPVNVELGEERLVPQIFQGFSDILSPPVLQCTR